MRSEIEHWVTSYPIGSEQQTASFRQNRLRQLVTRDIPASIGASLPVSASNLTIVGSIGKGGWTSTPWVMLLDPSVTTSVQEGYYIAYIMSADGKRLYLSLNQGCTILRKEMGTHLAQATLRHRAQLMWSRVSSFAARLQPMVMDLAVDRTVWRGKLYEQGLIAGCAYDTSALPSARDLLLDLFEAVLIYEKIKVEGGWQPDDVILRGAIHDGVAGGMRTAIRYHQHQAIERQKSHSEKVKRLQGTRCKGCGLDMKEVYGEHADGMIDAHHLTPLSRLERGIEVTFNPLTDFAVLCPNCHRAAHRMEDVGDIESLRSLVRSGILGRLVQPR